MGDYFRKKTVENVLEQVRQNQSGSTPLQKHLGVKDLTGFGIAAIIGAGIFSTIGKASFDGGPAVIFLFLFTAIACSFAAFAYAEFASMVPASGSAYTYSYVAFGELAAWIIGWSLIMEYAIGNITVAISWSDYLTSFLANPGIGINLPQWIQMDYFSAYKGFQEAQILIENGLVLNELSAPLQNAYTAWIEAPTFFGLHLVLDIPALFIIVAITWLVYRGIQESKRASNLMVLIKIAVIIIVVAVGIFYIDVDNWNPFAPKGVNGILKGVSAVFFAYIGFDAISTTAEECKDPQRDLPRGMMWAIIICTIVYIVVALVLTGVVNYTELNVGDPLLLVFEKINMQWLSGVIGLSAIIAMASVLLVFQMGQPRIWMSMSRDGLLPKRFARIHPKYNTPSYATIVVGFVVAIPALFLNLETVTDLCSIGTLFAFVMVCAGVLVLQNNPNVQRGKFKTPYLNSKYILPVSSILLVAYLFTSKYEPVMSFIKNEPQSYPAEQLILKLDKIQIKDLEQQLHLNSALSEDNLLDHLTSMKQSEYDHFLDQSGIEKSTYLESGFFLFTHKIPTWIFILSMLIMNYLCYKHNLSLIPTLGLISCFYMMSELGIHNWIGFTIWLIVGLVIYFSYSHKHSNLNKTHNS